MRKFSLLLVLFICAGAFSGMMTMKTDVQGLVAERLELVQQQRLLKEELRVLKAEYAHLTRPERLLQEAEKMGFTQAELWRYAPFKQGF